MSLFPETNAALIAKVKDLGDGHSWTEFLGIYEPAIAQMARRRGMQDADVSDVVQQVLTSVARSIEDWMPRDGGPPFRAWIAAIARNAISNALARKPIDAATGGTSAFARLHSLPAQASLDATRAELDGEARKHAVLWAAEQIRHEYSPEVWQCFALTALHGRSVSDVAAELNRSSGSIYVARYRIIARLKEKVQELSQAWDIGDFEL